MGSPFRFFACQVCCNEVSILECVYNFSSESFRILRVFSLPLDEIYLWKPRFPLYLTCPSNLFFLKQVDLLCPPEVECELAVRFEYDKSVPFPIHLVYWGYGLLEENVEDMEYPAVILGGRIDVIDKWLDKLGPPLADTRGFSANIVSFYSLFRYWESIKEIRQKNKVGLALLCGANYTDLIILGENPREDWLRTFSRPYGNISLIWDIKETLETYFAKTGPSVGTIPLTREVSFAYIMRTPEMEEEKEWEQAFEDQVGVSLRPLPIQEILAEYIPEEKAHKCPLAFGLAMMLAKTKFMVPRILLEIEHTKDASSVSIVHVLMQLGLFVTIVGAGGYYYLAGVSPLLDRRNEIVNLKREYKRISPKIRRWEQKKGLLLLKEERLASTLKLQYSWPEIIIALAKSLGSSEKIRVDGVSGKIGHGKKDFISFSVQLSADDYDSLNEFLSNLRALGWFSRISPVSSDYDNKTGKVKMLLVVEKWQSDL